MPDPQVYAAMKKFRAALLNAEAASAERLVNGYATIFQRLQKDIRALEADIMVLGDGASPAKVRRLARYNELLNQTVEEMTRYAVILENEVTLLRSRAIQDAINQNKTLVQAALPNLPPRVRASVLTNFNRLDPVAIENLLGALQEGSPLVDLLNTFGVDAAGQISDVILQGVALGYNPQKVADRIVELMGSNLTRALTIARTEMLRAYRVGNLANYAANSDIVKGWKWSASFDKVTCLACLALDGQEFALSEIFMKAHPNCRCAPTPVTITYKDMGLDVPELPNRQTAREWFATLPETEQQGFFSKAAWNAYKQGAVKLDDFVGLQHSTKWGDSYIERSLKDILGNDAQIYSN